MSYCQKHVSPLRVIYDRRGFLGRSWPVHNVRHHLPLSIYTWSLLFLLFNKNGLNLRWLRSHFIIIITIIITITIGAVSIPCPRYTFECVLDTQNNRTAYSGWFDIGGSRFNSFIILDYEHNIECNQLYLKNVSFRFSFSVLTESDDPYRILVQIVFFYKKFQHWFVQRFFLRKHVKQWVLSIFD